MSRLKELYKNEIMDAMTKKFGYKNVMEVPKLDKIVINMGVGEAKENAKLLDAAIADMELITGQKAIATKAKKSVANFKIREGMPIGCKVTLRGEKSSIQLPSLPLSIEWLKLRSVLTTIPVPQPMTSNPQPKPYRYSLATQFFSSQPLK